MTPWAKSVWLVIVQLSSIVYLLLTGPIIAMHPIWGSLELVGLALIVWALATMGFRQLRATPEVAESARLVTHGPYRFIRHPMYLSVLLTMLSLVMYHFSVWRLVAWLVLLTDLLVKLHFEESLLSQRFPEYREYQRGTKRLVPGLY